MAEKETQTVAADEVGPVPAGVTAPEPRPQTNAERYPTIWPLYQKICERERELSAPLDKLREERDKVVAETAPLEARARELAEQMKPLKPPLAAVQLEKAALARAMGGRTTAEPAPEPAAADKPEETKN